MFCALFAYWFNGNHDNRFRLAWETGNQSQRESSSGNDLIFESSGIRHSMPESIPLQPGKGMYHGGFGSHRHNQRLIPINCYEQIQRRFDKIFSDNSLCNQIH